MTLNEKMIGLTDEYESYIIDCRRKIHTFAEVAAHEEKTRNFILDEARKLGLPFDVVPSTSVIIKLDTGRPGMHVALRADIDALPMKESPTNLTGSRTCVSEQKDTFHACGHDAHAAMLLGAMQILFQLRDELNGVILFCFEEGEELNSGVNALLAALENYQVDRVWGIHVYAALEEGKISVDPGPRMAGSCVPVIKLIGKAGHGSRPDLAVNPLFCGAALLNNLCVAFCNQVTAGETVTMGITTFHAGTAMNIIDDVAEIGGTFRFFNMAEGRKVHALFRQVAEHTAAMHNCEVVFPPIFDVFAAPVVNDAACSAVAQQVLREVLPTDTVVSCDPWYAGESFRLWLERYPGVLAFLGINNKEQGYGAEHHNEKFDLSETVLRTGVISTVRYAVEWLQ